MKAFVTLALVASLALLGTVVETEAGGVTVQIHGTTAHSGHWQHQGDWQYRRPHYVYVPAVSAPAYWVPVAPEFTADPRWQWDGLRWWFWDGYRWIAY